MKTFEIVLGSAKTAKVLQSYPLKRKLNSDQLLSGRSNLNCSLTILLPTHTRHTTFSDSQSGIRAVKATISPTNYLETSRLCGDMYFGMAIGLFQRAKDIRSPQTYSLDGLRCKIRPALDSPSQSCGNPSLDTIRLQQNNRDSLQLVRSVVTCSTQMFKPVVFPVQEIRKEIC